MIFIKYTKLTNYKCNLHNRTECVLQIPLKNIRCVRRLWNVMCCTFLFLLFSFQVNKESY